MPKSLSILSLPCDGNIDEIKNLLKNLYNIDFTDIKCKDFNEVFSTTIDKCSFLPSDASFFGCQHISDDERSFT